MTDEVRSEKICPIMGIICLEEDCPAWLVLDDWEGCGFEFSMKAVKEVVKDGARLIDDLLHPKKPF